MPYRETMQKKVSGGGAKGDYDGISFPKSTRGGDTPRFDDKWQGKVKGKIKHTYGVDGKGDTA